MGIGCVDPGIGKDVVVMSRGIGIDATRSAFRWVGCGIEEGQDSRGVLYVPQGCPKKMDGVRGGYASKETWGNSMGFRRHVFAEKVEDGVERTTDMVPPKMGSGWIRAILTNRDVEKRPPLDSVSTVTLALPDHASVHEQDAMLSEIPPGTRETYVLWRPIAMVLGWMEQRKKDGLDNEALLGETVVTIDLDGPRPELAEVEFRRHDETGEVIPLHRRPKKAHVAEDDSFEDVARKTILGHVAEYEQLFSGQFAGDLQAAIESGVSETDVWVRKDGVWTQKTIELPANLDVSICREYINRLIGSERSTYTNVKKSILLIHGWCARRCTTQFKDIFLKFGCKDCVLLPAETIANGCACFSRRREEKKPTYYDFVPQYELWTDGSRWTSLFDATRDHVEPGEILSSETSPRLLSLDPLTDYVSVYIRPQPASESDVDPAHYARRLKVYFERMLMQKTELRLSAKVSVSKGSATFLFEMMDENVKALFLKKDKSVRNIEFRYTEESDGARKLEAEDEPLHKGYLESQPVSGRLYDSDFPYYEMLKAYNQNPNGDEYRRLFRGFIDRFVNVEAFWSRVGYNSRKGCEPTRGIFGTKIIPNKEAENKEAQIYANGLWRKVLGGFDNVPHNGIVDGNWCKALNYCHSYAPKGYKEYVRRKLGLFQEDPSWNFYFSPGYVLGECSQDLCLLMQYLEKRPPDLKTTPKLWWSLFRMLCWHPETKLTKEDVPLIEACLEKLVQEDSAYVNLSYGDNDRKFLLLAIVYMLRVRESEADLSEEIKKKLLALLQSGRLAHVYFPKTMIPKLGTKAEGTLSDFVIRFIQKEDTLQDRELGASMSCL